MKSLTRSIPFLALTTLILSPLAAAAQNPPCLDAPDGSPTCAVSVDNDGNTGIGTTVPEALLDVRGDAFFAPNECDLDGNGVVNVFDLLAVLDFVDGTTPATPANFASHDVTGDGKVSLDDVGFCLLRFQGVDPLTAKQTIDGGYGMVGSDRFLVDGRLEVNQSCQCAGAGFTADVVIGLPTAEASLVVFGPIIQRGTTLHADYVFEPGYQLETIAEHNVFMRRQKHLPAVPARTVDAAGLEVVEVGAHQRGVLEELEKAHLYIAGLQKLIQQQDERLARLEAAFERDLLSEE